MLPRTQKVRPDVKVIISGGYNQDEVSQIFVRKGLAGFIQKPYKISILQEIISKTAIGILGLFISVNGNLVPTRVDLWNIEQELLQLENVSLGQASRKLLHI